MNVFEDLIEELKEENLLEETVFETSDGESLSKQIGNIKARYSEKVDFPSQPENVWAETPKSNLLFDPTSILREMNVAEGIKDASKPVAQSFQIEASPLITQLEPIEPVNEADLAKLFAESAALESSVISAPSPTVTEKIKEPDFTEADEIIENNAQFQETLSLNEAALNENEFFRRRATEEVNSLQIVEHIISTIEREQMKIVPKIYDDIAVKMSLHDFLKITEDPQATEHTQAEFNLMQETESWYSALAHRDKHISIGDLRRYCETARPALSPQALVSLARFYRNSPFSEVVRNKFDVVITKLLTKDRFPDKREVVFGREELVKHLSGLYADWSSIPLYEMDNDSDVLLATLKIEDFISDATGATTFEELIRNDFFNRLRLFKESVGEKFFSPILTATAIECNVAVGNKYVELVAQEREKNNAKSLEEKYQFFLDQTVSEATSKTLQLVEILKEKKEDLKPVGAEPTVEQKEFLKMEPTFKKTDKKVKKSKIKINKWLLAGLILTIFGIGGLYIYVEVLTEPIKKSPSVIRVELDGSPLREYFKTARINRGTYFAVIEPGWDKLTKDGKEDILKKLLADGNIKGYTKIHLMTDEGKTVGYVSEKGIDLNPK